MSSINQSALVLDYLMKHGTIDSERARKYLEVRNLAARVKDLRDLGFKVSSQKEGTHYFYSISRVMYAHKKGNPEEKDYFEDDLFPDIETNN